VAVTSPQTRLALAGRRTGPPTPPPPLSPATVERAWLIHRRQLRLALGALALLALLLLGLPLALAAAPGWDRLRLAGVPLSWLAVAVLPYPVLALLAGWQLRRAERTEQDERPERAERPG
jgi:membrane protein implicated in regulation of membrane protease activity